MNYLFLLLVATIACINAAPAPAPDEEKSIDEDIADLKAVFQPIEQELRTMYDNAEFAVKDLTELAVKSASDLAGNAKEIINPADRTLSRNMLEEAKNLITDAQGAGKEFIDRAISDYGPLKANERAAFMSAGTAVKMLQDKYLTKDGQELVKALTGAAKKITLT